MTNFCKEEILKNLKKNLRTGREKLEARFPDLENRLFEYAGKMGVKPEDIEKTRDRIRERVGKYRKKG